MPEVVLWRNNCGVLADRHGRAVRYGLCPGSSDLIGILAPSGRLLALEVKRPSERPTAEQTRFLDLVRRMGGVAAIVTSAAEAVAVVEEAKRGQE